MTFRENFYLRCFSTIYFLVAWHVSGLLDGRAADLNPRMLFIIKREREGRKLISFRPLERSSSLLI